MKTQQLLRSAAVVALGLLGGAGLGFFQDDLTQRLWANLATPLTRALFVGAPLASLGLTAWYGLASRIASLRRFGIRPTLEGFLFLLSWWLSTIAGGIAFFLINGMDYMTIPDVIRYSAWAGTAYNFVLVVLPLLVISALRPARRPA